MENAAPEMEIEITPAMIEAGAAALKERYLDLEYLTAEVSEETVTAIFLAMLHTRPVFPNP